MIKVFTLFCFFSASIALSQDVQLRQLQADIDALKAQFQHRQLQHDGHDMTGNASTPAASDTDHSNHNTGTSAGHTFAFTSGNEVMVLFSGWTTSGWTEYIESCLFVIFLGFILEAITTFRQLYPYNKDAGVRYMFARSPAVKSVDSASTSEPITMKVHIVRTPKK